MILKETIKEKYLDGFTQEEKKSLYACAAFYESLINPQPGKVLQAPPEIQYLPFERIYRPAEVEFKYALNRLKMKDPSYVSAYFSDAHLGDEKVGTFVNSIPKESPCSYFFFRDCDMTEKGAQAIAHALYKKEVSFLDISSNPIGAVGARAIATALKTAPWREVKMYDVDMPLEAASFFYKMIAHRKHNNDHRLSRLLVDFKVPAEKESVARSVQKDLSRQVYLLSAPLLTDMERAVLSGRGRGF